MIKLLFIVIIEFLLLMNIRFVKPVRVTDETETVENQPNIKENETKLKIINQNVKNGDINFTKNKIILTFNKNIQCNNKLIKLQGGWYNKSTKKDFTFKISKNKLEMIFKNKLKKNTTYIINFQKGSLKTFNNDENDEFSIAFSTGKNIDKNEIHGEVIDILKNKKAGNCIISLYKMDDECIKKKISNKNILNCDKPDYYSETDKDGKYIIKNVKEGTYFICAEEICKNKNYNLRKYGFIDEFIKVKNTTNIERNIEILKNNFKEFKILEKTYEKDSIKIKVSDEISKYDIEIQNELKDCFSKCVDDIKKATSIEENKKEICIKNKYLGLISDDTLPCHLKITSKHGDVIDGNIYVKFVDSNDDYEDEEESNKNTIEIKSELTNPTVYSTVNFKITSDKKIIEINKEKISLKILDKYEVNSRKISNFSIIKKDKEFHIKTPLTVGELVKHYTENNNDGFWDEDVSVLVLIQDNAVTFNNFKMNKEISKSIKFAKKTSDLIVKCDIKTNHFKVQLLDKDYNIVSEFSENNIDNKNEYCFEKISDGEYFIRYFCWDKDEWSYGDIFKNEKHDRISFYKKKIKIGNYENNEKILLV